MRIVIKMARKLTRYKVNRQFRKNPTRSRVFFPYMLPFQADFRTVKIPDGNKLKNQVVERLRKRARDALDSKNPDLYRSVRRKVSHAMQVVSRGYMKGAEKLSHSAGQAVMEASFYSMYPEAALPVGMAQLGVDMIRNPKKYSQILGGTAISGSGLAFYMMQKRIIPH